MNLKDTRVVGTLSSQKVPAMQVISIPTSGAGLDLLGLKYASWLPEII